MTVVDRLEGFLRVVRTYPPTWTSYCCAQLQAAIGHARRRSWDAVAMCLGRAAEQLFAMALHRTPSLTRWADITSLWKVYDACVAQSILSGRGREKGWIGGFNKQRNTAAHGTRPVPQLIDEQFIHQMLNKFGDLLTGSLFEDVRERAWR